MKRFQQITRQYRGLTEGLLILLLLAGMMTGVFLGCGKLSDDTDRPTNPIGSSSSGPIPITPESSYGDMSLRISADPESIPADGVNYTTINAYLEDTSGRSVAGYQITFSSDALGFFSPTTNNIGYTDNEGHVSVRLLGRQSGSCVVEASVDLGTGSDLVVRTTVTFTSGGIPASAGNYSLRIWATPDTVPADLATYSTVIAKLTDHTGGTVENFIVNFSTEDSGNYGLGYLHNSPIPPTTWSTTVNGTTNALGDSSVYFYGSRRGSAVVQACVTIPDLDEGQLCDTVWISVTEGAGDLGDDIQGLLLHIEPVLQILQADDTGYADAETVTLTALVWDETGDPVGEGVRVEFTGDVNGFANTDSTGTAVLDFAPGKLPVGTYNYTVTACTIIRSISYCETGTFTITVTPPDPAQLTIELTAVPDEIQVGDSSTSEIIARVLYENQLMKNVTVNFQTTLGSLSSSLENTNPFGITTVLENTNPFGIATVFLTAGSVPGVATVYASATIKLDSGGVATGYAEVEITIIQVPDQIILNVPDVAMDRTGGETAVSATVNVLAQVLDTADAPISGLTLTFTVVDMSNCAGVNFVPPVSTTATTNAGGYAEPTFTAEGTANTTAPHCQYTIEAIATGLEPKTDTATITVTGF